MDLLRTNRGSGGSINIHAGACIDERGAVNTVLSFIIIHVYSSFKLWFIL